MIKDNSAAFTSSSNWLVHNMVFQASPLMVLVLFITGIFTKPWYYNSLIKQRLQTEHVHHKRFVAFWNTSWTENEQLWHSDDFSDLSRFWPRNTMEIHSSDASWHWKFKTTTTWSREFKLLHIFARDPPFSLLSISEFRLCTWHLVPARAFWLLEPYNCLNYGSK